ncbi:MAG: glutamyl-tRNA synthetase [Thermoplasmatales archaeon SG8-52-3]|nr:MAG: glutamyl-tRNA synthetase [Thermoplasmatales archaeon SG8-52-3]
MAEEKIRKTARIYALQNAVQFNGKANPKAVIGKVIAVLQKEGFSPKELIPIINRVTLEVNNLTLDNQKKELEDIAPELLKKEKKERDFSLPDLPNGEKGGVVTRFPPEPNGYLHIGHAKAAIVDYEYARMYDGKFILRFDDTNPDNAHLEFYDAQKEDLKWLGIDWDEEYNTSDNIEKHYKLAEQLIRQDHAYVCTCDSDFIKECRFNGKECDCRCIESGESLDIWKEMISSSIQGAILRLRGDMTCVNTAMRDPTLFRIIEKEHPLQGDKYRVWPTYDFSGAVEDSLSGVTHPFRTKEYELRDECYFKLLDLLGIRKPHLMEFARLSIEGMPVSKRKIKPLIDKGDVLGYDDIRLPTLRGLKKRGILPEAIKKFVIEQGISKVESSVTFGLLEAANRKIIDPITKRYFYVSNPVKLTVDNAPHKEKKIDYYPRDKKLGSRTIETDKIFYVEKQDMEKLKVGDIFRLKDLFNVKIINKNNNIIGEFVSEELIPDSLKIQWTTDRFVNLNVFIPHLLFINDKFNNKSLEEVKGYAEESISNIKKEEIVQFERFGFVRVENVNKKLTGFFTHK